MPESMLLAAAAGVVAGALAVGVVLLLRRIVGSSKELGTDVEQATYQTLHLASRAAKHLRGGVEPFTVGIAVRHRKPIAPLPDAQHILRQADIPLDRRNGELGFFHFVLDNRLTR